MKLRISATAIGLWLFMVASLFAAPAYATPDPALFGQLPQAHDAAISPDGKQIAVLQNHQGQYIINVINLETLGQAAEPRVIGLEEGVKPDYLKWVSNDRIIVSIWQSARFRRTPFNAGFLYSLDIKTMEAELLIDSGSGGEFRQFNNRVLDWLEDDPDHIIMAFAADGLPQNYPDVRRVNVKTGRSKVTKKRAESVNAWVTDSQGIARVGRGWRNNGKDAFLTIQDPATGKWEGADHFPGIDPETMSVLAITHEGKSLVMRAYRGKDTLGLHRYDLVSKSFVETLYENDRYDVGAVILSKDGNEIVGARFTGESDERVLFDKFNSTYEEAIAQFSEFDVKFVDQSADSNQLLLRISSPSEPGGIYLYRRGGETIKIVGALQGLSGNDMGEVIAVNYTARDGAKIPSIVTLPKGVLGRPDTLPFIVLPHGGPFSRDAKEFDWLAQFYASRGYGVLQMNFRGSDGFGKSFSDAGRDSWVVMQEDVEDGMRWLLAKGYADPERSCIAGWSYGGYAAFMGAAKTPDLYRCVIAIAALTDIPETISDARKYTYGKARAQRTFGALMDDRSLMIANNPVDRARHITVPVFMAHGELDTSVEHDQFKTMKRRLERAGVDGTYMSFEKEDHYMSTQANRQAMIVGIAEFLDRVNGPSPFLPE